MSAFSSAIQGHQGSQISLKNRLQIQHLLNLNQFLATEQQDVIRGLTEIPKTMSPRFFYDDLGSQLFEQICELPEYYPTRTETQILEQFAGEIARITGACELVELGSGSSTKTRLLLNAYQGLGYPLNYLPIDVSAGILTTSAKQLLEDYPTLQIQGIVGTYEQAIAQLAPTTLPARLIFFLGSTLGNFTKPECDRFFQQITQALEPGDYFLLGIDLQKPPEILEAAYNDSQGVTAAFNLNMLTHLNHRFQGNFDLQNFEHHAFYNRSLHQIEMHLRAVRSHQARLEDLNLTLDFQGGESIRSEISRKFDLQTMKTYLNTWNLHPSQTWTDANNWFGLILAQRVERSV